MTSQKSIRLDREWAGPTDDTPPVGCRSSLSLLLIVFVALAQLVLPTPSRTARRAASRGGCNTPVLCEMRGCQRLCTRAVKAGAR